MSHRSARLTVHGRRILAERVLAGRPDAHADAETGASRPAAHPRVRRRRSEGLPGRPAGPAGPRQPCTPATVGARGCRLRIDRELGPARTGPVPGLPSSTVRRIPVRHGISRLAVLDRPTGGAVRR
ncbi:hypothetical protein ICJ52_07575 [Streptomyces sp. KD18]|nr:hypothetical protein [Streptomyces sp. KD18]GGS97035.1 hypothetical protein GCM10010286_22460 [Streptomyces toxytricini]